jgi:xanthine dehydrogenase molybdopterin-binding subunit B
MQMNAFYQQGQVTPYGEKLLYFSLPQIWQQLLFTSQYQVSKNPSPRFSWNFVLSSPKARLAQIQAFNAANRWVKRGISIVPCKFGVYWAGDRFGANVTVRSASLCIHCMCLSRVYV